MYYEIIKGGLEYIEQNLKTDISPDELARMAGYSKFHYCRLFSSITGSSVAEYIKKRRLDHALHEISSGRKAVEVVLEYGFETYAGFYKAFVSMYGCSPKKYLDIYKKHELNKPEVVIMHTEKELKKILENWDIPRGLPIEDIYIMDGAKVSGNVWVNGDYILKTGDRVKLMRNLAVSKALAAQGFSASVPVLTKSGTAFLDDGEIFILSRGIKGKPLDKVERFGPKMMSYGDKFGKSIARLHKALGSVDILPDEVDLYKMVMDWAMPEVRRQNIQWNMGIDESFFDDYTKSISKLYEYLPKQLIHRDPNPSNILFEDGVITGFIDFDLSERNVRLFDPCYCATGILSEADRDEYENWISLLKAVIDGYDSEAKLCAEEKQAVFYVICSIEMICAAFFESVDEYKQLAKTNRDMFIFIINNKDRIERMFK